MKYFKLYNILYILIFTFFTVILWDFLTQNSLYELDDLNSTINSYPLWREENGRYVCNILSRIVGLYIPLLLNIHLNDFINTGGAFCYLLILFGLIYSITKFFSLNCSNKYLFGLMMLIPTEIFIRYLIYFLGFFNYNLYSFQYGYVLASVFGISFMYFIYKYIIYNEEYSNKHLIFFILLGFCSGNSSQIVTGSTAVVIVLSIIYKFIEHKFNFEQIKKLLLKKTIISPIIGFFSGFALMVLCPGVWNEVSWRHASSFNEIISIAKPFMRTLVDYVFIRQEYYIHSIILLCILIIITGIIKKELLKGIKNIILGLFPVIGTLCYLVLMISGGRTYPSNPPGFWVQEPFYFYYYSMILALTIVFLSGYLIKIINNKFLKYTIASIIILQFIWNIIYYYNSEAYYLKKEEVKVQRRNVYICEKITLFQIYKGKNFLYVPQLCSDAGIAIINNEYLNYNYKIHSVNGSKQTDTESAMNEFYNSGGKLSKEELKEAKFAKLKDKKFVLGE